MLRGLPSLSCAPSAHIAPFAFAFLLACSGAPGGSNGADADAVLNEQTDAQDSPTDAAASPGRVDAQLPVQDAAPMSTSDVLGPLDAAPKGMHRNPQRPLACAQPLTRNPESTQLQRLTHTQFVNTLRDLFAGLVPVQALPTIASLPPEPMAGRFSSNAAGRTSSEAATTAREGMVVSLAEASVQDLPRLMGCEASSPAAEDACVDDFIDRFGLRAWRRPLSETERQSVKALFTQARGEFTFEESVSTVVGAMLEAPQFLFRIQEGVGQVNSDGGKLFSGYELAANLSYLIWNSMPDDELFSAAKDGLLLMPAELESQARRMLADPRAREAIASFQQEWLRIERLAAKADAAAKAAGAFPAYTQAQSAALRAGLEAFVADVFWTGDHSLATLLASSKAFVNDSSAAIYGVSAPGTSSLSPVTLNPTQRKGFLTQPAVMAGLAGSRSHSPAQRGAYVSETFLCAPPARDVSTPLLPEPGTGITFRQTYLQTVEAPSCQSCHKGFDGLGLLFENYDGQGVYRTQENGMPVDASGRADGTFDLDGSYANALAFSEALARSQQVAQCGLEHFYEFAVARSLLPEDGCLLDPLTDAFIASGTNMQQMLIDFVKSSAFRFRSGVAP